VCTTLGTLFVALARRRRRSARDGRAGV
jgi:hypothetical protein